MQEFLKDGWAYLFSTLWIFLVENIFFRLRYLFTHMYSQNSIPLVTSFFQRMQGARGNIINKLISTIICLIEFISILIAKEVEGLKS